MFLLCLFDDQSAAAALWSAAACCRFFSLELARVGRGSKLPSKENGSKLPYSKARESSRYFLCFARTYEFQNTCHPRWIQPKEHFGAVMTPIYQTSTFAFRA